MHVAVILWVRLSPLAYRALSKAVENTHIKVPRDKSPAIANGKKKGDETAIISGSGR